MRRPLVLATIIVAGACAEPSDVLYTPPPVTAVEVAPGLFQVTDDLNPDQVRGFTATGDTILFRGLRFSATGDHWEILGLPAAGGLGFIEHAALYRAALRHPVSTLVSRTNDRFLTWWQAGNDRDFYGPAGCPGPASRALPAWRQTLLHLQAQDGLALSAIPTWGVLTPTAETTVDAPLTLAFRLRFDFGQIEAELGANAFGPAISPDGSVGFYSDGEAVRRFAPANAGTPPDSVGPGIFPTLSADGALLAVAIPQGVDSTEIHTNGSTGIRSCLQDEWTLTATSWTTAVIRLATSDTIAKLDGTEPVLDPAGGRVLVRRPTGLVWVDLATKVETALANTAGAFSVAISPSGQYVAFSKTVSKNVDVYYVKLK